jgi:hypothetical protein
MTTDGTNQAPPPPAGWYPDPSTPGTQRYWDGSRWTEHTAPLQAAPTPASSAATIPGTPTLELAAAAATTEFGAPAQSGVAAAPSAQTHVVDSQPAKKRKTGRIVGGVLGGIAAVVILLIVVASLTAPSEGDPAAEDTLSALPTAIESPTATPAATETQTATVEVLDPVVDETAWGIDDGDDYYWYALTIENPNSDYVFNGAEVLTEAVGADGTILERSSTYVTLLSGTTALAGGFLEVGSETIDHLEVSIPTATDATFSPVDETGAFSVSQVDSTDDDWSTTVSGHVSSSFAEDIEYVRVTVLVRVDGEIVGANWEGIGSVPAGGEVRFETSFFPPIPEGAALEASASIM